MKDAQAQRGWWVPLRWRILAVNIFVIALLVGGFLYLDGYRRHLIEERQERLTQSLLLLNQALLDAPAARHGAILWRYASVTHSRIRLYDRASGTLNLDSFAMGPPTYALRDPAAQGLNRHAARALDRFLDWVVRALPPEQYIEPRADIVRNWPELRAAERAPGQIAMRYRFAPDRTPMLSVAIASRSGDILMLVNARDVTRNVRAERFELGLILAAVTILSTLLSLFLARTIVQPLQLLADAATRVRLGRARDVTVPRLPSRGDEIGQLARTLSDMTDAMHARIDAGEAFAADVAHELKNPLASLRSALEGLERVDEPALRQQLFAIARDDVWRLDRLISDIAEASRVDAELSRTRFERVDMGALIDAIVAARRSLRQDGAPDIAFARPRIGATMVSGEAFRLTRVIENLLDNAISFSPPGGIVRIDATRAHGDVIVRVEDDGPGVPPQAREDIFRRFHSVRPKGEAFGRHSGLGLAIARTIIEAHDGSIVALDRPDKAQGACFEIRLPAASE